MSHSAGTSGPYTLFSAGEKMRIPVSPVSFGKTLMLIAATSLVSACAGGGAVPTSRSAADSPLLRLIGVRESVGARVTAVLLTNPSTGKSTTLTLTERYSQSGGNSITDATVQGATGAMVALHAVENPSTKTTTVDTTNLVSGQSSHQTFSSLLNAVPDSAIAGVVSKISTTHSEGSQPPGSRRPQVAVAICLEGCLPLAETLAFYALCVATCMALSNN